MIYDGDIGDELEFADMDREDSKSPVRFDLPEKNPSPEPNMLAKMGLKVEPAKVIEEKTVTLPVLPQQVYNNPTIINNYNMSSNGDLRASFASQTADIS